MSPKRLYNHTYNLRKKRNRIYDLSRKQTQFQSPHKNCVQCGVKHKKQRLVEPKSRKKLNREVIKTMSGQDKDRLPTAEDIQRDIERARKGPPLRGKWISHLHPL